MNRYATYHDPPPRRPLHFALLIHGALLAGCSPEQQNGGRILVESSWDTLFVLGGRTINDTTFGDPDHITLWGDQLAVTDPIRRRVVAIGRDGTQLWESGRRGEGPGEYLRITDLAVTPHGNLWVVDNFANRVTEYDPAGMIVDIHTSRTASALYSIMYLPDRLVQLTSQTRSALRYLDPVTLEVQSTAPIPWRDSIPPTLRSGTIGATAHRPGAFVLAFVAGPGFMVIDGDSTAAHDYIEPIDFVLRWTPENSLQPGTYITRFAARSVAVVGDSIFILFGGNTRYFDTPARPTRYIDTYRMDGTYLRTLQLPFGAKRIATDGEFFFLSRSEPLPSVVGLRYRPPR